MEGISDKPLYPGFTPFEEGDLGLTVLFGLRFTFICTRDSKLNNYCNPMVYYAYTNNEIGVNILL